MRVRTILLIIGGSLVTFVGVGAIVVLLVLDTVGAGDCDARGGGPGVQGSSAVLTYRAVDGAGRPGAPAEVDETARGLCERLAKSLDADFEVRRDGTNRVVVEVPASRQADVRPGRGVLLVYDWEQNLLDESCKSFEPAEAATRPSLVGRDKAERAAARCDGLPTKLVRDERPENMPANLPTPDRWFLVRDEPELTGADVEKIEVAVDARTEEPILTLDFTTAGEQKFEALSRRIAQRGAAIALPSSDVLESAQHFAIVLDDQLLSRPFIDFRENPDGIDGAGGAQISGGFSKRDAERLFDILTADPLPLALEPVG